MLSAHLPLALAAVAFVGVLLLIGLSDARNFQAAKPMELTTSIAALLVFVAGYLVGDGHVFTPVASAIVITMLLAWKLELRKFAGGLTLEEIRSAVLLGLLGFVIYPIIPNRFVDRWQLVNPRAAWVIVIVIAGIGFVNYVLLKLYGTRGIYVSGFLGGLVNSTAAAAELAKPLGAGSTSLGVAIAALLLTIVAMFARNLVIGGDFFAGGAGFGRGAVDRDGDWRADSGAARTGAGGRYRDGDTSGVSSVVDARAEFRGVVSGDSGSVNFGRAAFGKIWIFGD
jgi:uncharacterized membrane protein (DUF4010 family)